MLLFIYLSKNEVNALLERNTENVYYPFADICQFSVFPEVEEILFFVGLIFRIDSVEPDDDLLFKTIKKISNER
jgi:hypothetical protein